MDADVTRGTMETKHTQASLSANRKHAEELQSSRRPLDQKLKDINYWSKAIGNSLAIVSFKNKGKNKDLF